MKKISYLFLILAIVLVYKNLFLLGPLVFGDAPYFYSEGLRELVAAPSLWTTRGVSLGGINLFIFIYPIMVLYGILGSVLNLGNDLVLRVLFYFPALVCGGVGIYLLGKYWKLPGVVGFFATLIYLVNTYFILLIDGGQVGVVLAYGVFPVALNFILKYLDKADVKNYVTALLIGFILTVADFRIAAICIVTALFLKLREWRRLKYLLLIIVSLIGLSLYWIIPAINLSSELSTNLVTLNTTSLLNTLMLAAPNWPFNEFGKVIPPYFYFGIVPVLIFLSLFIIKDRKVVWFTFLFLIFAFLAKGTTPPFGDVYGFLITTKVGSVLRDSTKFFIPLTLIGGVLIGYSIYFLSQKIKVKPVIHYCVFFILFIFLVWQALGGKLNGVLGGIPNLRDYEVVKQLVTKDEGFKRSAWFIEKSPFAYHTDISQSLDAKDLVNLRPLGYLNAGTGDKFNFVNNKDYLEWFNLLGIKYLVLQGNPRVKEMNKSDSEDWQRLNNLIAADLRLKKVDSETSFFIYENSDVKPNKFFVDKTLLIVGGDDIYEKLREVDPSFSVGNQGILFFEDGKLDPLALEPVASTSAVMIFNDKAEDDLKMSFLQKNFLGPKDAISSEWARYSGSDYLEYKWQLLMREIEVKDMDYSKGIAFSTKQGEKITFRLEVPEDGDYILAIRKMDKGDPDMHWVFEDRNGLAKGEFNYIYENTKGLEILNVVGLISKKDFNKAQGLTDNFLGTFPTFNIDDKNDQVGLVSELSNLKWKEIKSDEVEATGWVIFSDNYHVNWSGSYPMYSGINGFYVKKGESISKKVVFREDDLRWGIYWSSICLILITIGVLWRVREHD